MTTAALAGLALALAVLMWPAGERVAQAQQVLAEPGFDGAEPGFDGAEPGFDGAEPGFDGAEPGFDGAEPGFEGTEAGSVGRGRAPGGADSARGAPRSLRELWSADPVEVMREWRRRRRAPSTVDGALKLLEGVAPALEAGLTPAVALRLSGAALGSGADASTLRMVDEVTRAGERGDPVARVWRSWAEAGRSPDLRFVAAAWQLSEMTGAPLAEAVHRAVSSLREARERTRRVHVAVAGPRATVVVLTLLPLTGPLFGLACGVGPAELYLASPLSAAAASLGLALIWAGRRWCRRLVESVTAVGGTSGSERRSLA